METTVQLINWFEKLPFISKYSKTKGWSFIISWAHRLSGLLLVIFIWYHIYNLSALLTPLEYQRKMAFFGGPIFLFLQWLLSIPLIFHATNGARLILYELFSFRNNDSLIRWALGISLVYVILLAMLMILNNQNVSAIFFWLLVTSIGIGCAIKISSKLKTTRHSVYWRAQRLTASYLLAFAPAHMLFMHLNYFMSHDVTVVVTRMQSIVIKIIDLSFILALFYHISYGLMTIVNDYVELKIVREVLKGIIVVVALMFIWIGIRVIIFV